MRALVSAGLVAAIAALTLSVATLFFGQVGQKDFDKYLFNGQTLERVSESVVTQERVSQALDPYDRSSMLEFVRPAAIQITVIPLEPDKEGKKDPFAADQVETFALVGAKKVLLPNVVPALIENYPQTLDDGRPYTLRFDVVLLPDTGTENAQFQEPLGTIVYPNEKVKDENMVPVLVLERTRPVLAKPGQEWPTIAASSAITEGGTLWQAVNFSGAMKSIEVKVVEVLPNGFVLFSGNFDSPAKGSILFTPQGLPVALMVDQAGAHTGVAMPLETIMNALMAEGTISEYSKAETQQGQ